MDQNPLLVLGHETLKKPVVIGIVVVCAALAGGGAYVATRGGAVRDNVILIAIDTTRADSFGCYGSKRGATPNLDQLAAEGVRFEQAFGHAPWTLPSIASLLTSTYPTTHGAFGKQWSFEKFTGIRPSIVSGAQAFQKAGFTTHAIVNAVFLDRGLGLERGFDEYDIYHSTNGKIRRADECVRLALEHLKDHRGERNFLFLHLFDPHLRYDPPPGWGATFVGDYRGPLRNMPPRQLDNLTGRMMRPGFTPPPQADQAYLRNMHLAELAFVDAKLGKLFEGLKSLGLYDRSTIVVTADHGEEFWDHGGFEHGHTLYDELIHLPLIIKPGQGASAGDAQHRGSVVSQTVRQIDIMPTLLEITGVDAPKTFEGQSFLAALRRGVGRPGGRIEPRAVFSEEPHYARWKPPSDHDAVPRFTNELVALREDGYKFIIDLSTGDAQLYHVAADVDERNNVIGDEPERAAAMRRQTLAKARELLEHAATLGPAPPFDMHEDYFRTLMGLGYIQTMPAVPPNWSDTPKLEKVKALESDPPG